MSESRRPTYPIASVDSALRLLLLFRDRQALRLSEVSAELGVVRSTAHRLLAMLQYHDFVRQDPDTRVYVVGPALVDVGLAAMRGIDVRGAARPVLATVEAELHETCHVMSLVGASIVFLESVESRRAVRTGARAGVRLPAHCTSGGKALLAQLPLEVVAQLYDDEQLARMTPQSPPSLQALERELVGVRELGYGTNFGESEADIAAIAVAVPTTAIAPHLALAVSTPISRLTLADGPRVAAVLRGAASVLAARLSGTA